MTEFMLDIAEELFLANQYVNAYRMAKTALNLDPFFGSIDRYVAAYRVHAASLKKNEDGEIDWYNVLGFDDYSVSTEALTHRFCRMGKLIDPDNHCSAAAEGAYKLVVRAFEVLGDPDARVRFHRRWNLPICFKIEELQPSVHSRRPRSAAVAIGCSSSRINFNHQSRLVLF